MLKHDVDWENLKKGVRYPRQAIDVTLYEILYPISATFAKIKTTIGANIFNRDRDNLILLNNYEVDALEAVAPEYEFLSGIDSLRSVGGSSPE